MGWMVDWFKQHDLKSGTLVWEVDRVGQGSNRIWYRKVWSPSCGSTTCEFCLASRILNGYGSIYNITRKSGSEDSNLLTSLLISF